MLYTATFTPEPEGGYTVTFADLPGCITYGETFELAYDMAIDAMALWMADQTESFEPTPIENLAQAAEPGEQLVPIKLDTKLMESYTKTARINLSLPGNSLHKIDQYLSDNGGDRSKLMTAATLEFIGANR